MHGVQAGRIRRIEVVPERHYILETLYASLLTGLVHRLHPCQRPARSNHALSPRNENVARITWPVSAGMDWKTKVLARRNGSYYVLASSQVPVNSGGVAEWLKARDSKSCGQKCLGGSNPPPSAIFTIPFIYREFYALEPTPHPIA
jgi:hypothetical protein